MHRHAWPRPHLAFLGFCIFLRALRVGIFTIQNLIKGIKCGGIGCLPLIEHWISHLHIWLVLLQFLQGNQFLNFEAVLRVLQQIFFPLEKSLHFLVIALRTFATQLWAVVHLNSNLNYNLPRKILLPHPTKYNKFHSYHSIFFNSKTIINLPIW